MVSFPGIHIIQLGNQLWTVSLCEFRDLNYSLTHFFHMLCTYRHFSPSNLIPFVQKTNNSASCVMTVKQAGPFVRPLPTNEKVEKLVTYTQDSNEVTGFVSHQSQIEKAVFCYAKIRRKTSLQPKKKQPKTIKRWHFLCQMLDAPTVPACLNTMCTPSSSNHLLTSVTSSLHQYFPTDTAIAAVLA